MHSGRRASPPAECHTHLSPAVAHAEQQRSFPTRRRSLWRRPVCHSAFFCVHSATTVRVNGITIQMQPGLLLGNQGDHSSSNHVTRPARWSVTQNPVTQNPPSPDTAWKRESDWISHLSIKLIVSSSCNEELLFSADRSFCCMCADRCVSVTSHSSSEHQHGTTAAQTHTSKAQMETNRLTNILKLSNNVCKTT